MHFYSLYHWITFLASLLLKIEKLFNRSKCTSALYLQAWLLPFCSKITENHLKLDYPKGTSIPELALTLYYVARSLTCWKYSFPHRAKRKHLHQLTDNAIASLDDKGERECEDTLLLLNNKALGKESCLVLICVGIWVSCTTTKKLMKF